VTDRDDDWTGDDAEAAAASEDSDRAGERSGRTGVGSRTGVDPARVITYLLWGGVIALGVLAVVAAAGLYGSLTSIVDVWIGDRYQPFARAVLNFGVLCVAAAGIAVLVRRV